MKIGVYLSLITSVFLAGCGGIAAPKIVEPETQAATATVIVQPESERSLLTSTDLSTGFSYSAPVVEAALTQPEAATPPQYTFEGRLELHSEGQNGEIGYLRGRRDIEPFLPEFDFEFVQQDGYLIPAKRGLIVTEHEYWNYFLEPGRVWSEPGDGDYSRASFPFALSWKGSNAIHNGTMTFLFNDEEISSVWYQITQETGIGIAVDMWGLLEASYHSEPLAAAAKIRADFTQELVDHFPTKPIADLGTDYPQLDISAFGQGVTPERLTWYGFVIDGVNYVGGCQTRYGTYPYCEYMRAPSYSTAKSAFASVALMRLAQKYDPAAPAALIKDYVPEAAASPGDWSAVTFDDTLDMATGNFKTSAFMVDEEQWNTDPFWSEEYYAPKIAAAFNWPHSAEPGTTWVYRTFDTFIVTRAMHNYLQSFAGENADIYNFVVEDVYRPLKMGPGVFTTLRTKDNQWQGQAYGGYGQWWIPDDLAKITTLLNADQGQIAGEQILHPQVLAAALQHDPADRGVPRGRGGRYNNAFWADLYHLAGCKVWVPEMYGYSGILVSMMPNGTSYYYASDGEEFESQAVIKASHDLRSMCGSPGDSGE